MTDMVTGASPVFTIGGEVRGELALDALALEIQESTAGMKSLRCKLLAQGRKDGSTREQLIHLDGSVLDFGKKVEVALGPAGEARTVFQGFISALEVDHAEGREPHVIFHAEDRLMDLRMTRRMKTYEQVSDAGIAQAIAQEHGLSAEATAEGPTYDVVQQWNQSDLAFLRARARLIQAEVWISEDTLYFQSRSQRQATDITLVTGNQLIQLNVRADLAHQRTAVHVSGYDASKREPISEDAGVAAIQAEVSGGRTGPEVLELAFGTRVSFRVREELLTAGEAGEFARTEMLRRSRGFVTALGVTNGTPDMVVGSRLSLERAGVPFDGPGYYVTRVSHTYDLTNGYRTQFEAERATVHQGEA